MRTTRTVFVAMLREEWRMHASLFGGVRFIGMPVVVTVAELAVVWALTTTGTAPGQVVAGLFALTALLGLQIGSIGFVGRDAARNVLRDLTPIVFSGRTLPLSQRRLLSLFLVKDGVFYAGFFLLPMAIGLFPIVTVERVPLLWASLIMTFLWGAATTLALISLSTRGRSGRVLGIAGALTVGALLLTIPAIDLTPFGFFRTPDIGSLLGSIGGLAGLATIAIALYDPTYTRPARTVDSSLIDRLTAIFPGPADPLLRRTLIDVGRSSGGFWKLLLSASILFAVTAFLIDLVGRITGVRPLPGVGFGAILGLTAFTTYNWLTQYDDLSTYRLLPVDLSDGFRAKARAFQLLGLPTGLFFYAVAVVWHDASPLDGLTGVVILLGLQWYLFGLTVALTGFDPGRLLFDTVRFATFTAGVAVVLVPLLVVGFVVGQLDAWTAAALALMALAAGALGVWLYRRSGARWRRRLRE